MRSGMGTVASSPSLFSAIDIALWDVAGKAQNLPVHALLGGRVHRQFIACASVILNTLDLDALAEEFAGYRARGFTAVKGGWGQEPSAGFGIDEARDLQVARTIREAVGKDVAVALDVSARAHWDSARSPYGASARDLRPRVA